MSKPDNQEPILPLFHLTEKFPDAKAIFSTPIPSLEDFKKNALIVLDTNVLLIPYLIQPKSLDDIKNTYEFLINENRLFIPAQVAREFAKNRGEKIQNLFHEITLKQNINVKKVDYKLLEPLAEYGELIKLEEELTTKIKEYRKIVSNVLAHIKSWRWNDPVSKLYQDLFKPELVIETSKTPKDIEADLERRITNRISPGYKDSSKDDKGIGDIIIWNTILELGTRDKKTLIFVTGEEKSDWMLGSSGEALYPNFDLIEEYARISDGKTFHILKFSELLELFEVKKEVIEEVEQEEIQVKHLKFENKKKELKTYYDAEKAVYHWLSNYYLINEIEVIEQGFVDFIVNTIEGERIGISVKVNISMSGFSSVIKNSFSKVNMVINKYRLHKFIVVMTYDEQTKSQLVVDLPLINKFSTEDFSVIIGTVDELNMFRAIFDTTTR